MHELSLVTSLLQYVDTYVQSHGYKCVKKIVVKIGVFATIEFDALAFAFDVAKTDTCASNAKLVIEKELATGVCLACNHKQLVESYKVVCEQCGKTDFQFNGGKCFILTEMEVE